MKVPDSLQA